MSTGTTHLRCFGCGRTFSRRDAQHHTADDCKRERRQWEATPVWKRRPLWHD